MKRIIYISFIIIINFSNACKQSTEPTINDNNSNGSTGENDDSGQTGGNGDNSDGNNGSGGNGNGIKSWKTVGDGNIYVGLPGAPLSITISDSGIPYIVYQDVGTVPPKGIVIKKLNDNRWEEVGNNSFSGNGTSYISIEVSKTDIPYVTYISADKKVNIYSLRNNNWISLYTPADFNNSKSVSLALSSLDDAYICYQTDNYPAAGTYVNNKWQSLGKISNSKSHYTTDITVSKSGIPYVTCVEQDINNTRKYYITVKKYINSKWETVGAEKFAKIRDEFSDSSSLTIYNNTPYVAYLSEEDNGVKATVMKYEEGTWKVIGNEGFSNRLTQNISIKISENGVIYVSYIDTLENFRLKIVSFDGNSWRPVGADSLFKDIVNYSSFNLSKDGIPYVAYHAYTGQKIVVMKFE